MKKIIINENQYRKIKKHLNEIALRTYVFDWDDNILRMPTKIKMDKRVGDNWEPVEVSTEDFAHVRTNPDYRLKADSFDDFRLTDSFLHDTVVAIKNKSYAPSFNKFKEALIYANPFAINTARGHKPDALKEGVKLFINMVLTDDEKQTMISNIKKEMSKDDFYYKMEGLNDNQLVDFYLDEFGEYYPVSSDEFGKRFGLETSGKAANPEHAKKVAIEHFTKKVLNNVQKLVDSGHYTEVSLGFSDDDVKNVNASVEFIQDELRRIYPEIHFVVYNTTEGGKEKIVVHKGELKK